MWEGFLALDLWAQIGVVGSIASIVGLAGFLKRPKTKLEDEGSGPKGGPIFDPPNPPPEDPPQIYIGVPNHGKIIGRDGMLADLHSRLSQTATVAVTALNGMGGVGKSTVAAEFAKRYRGDYHGIVWIDADQEQGRLTGITELAKALDKIPQGQNDLLSPMDARSLIQKLPKAPRPWLLVYDNVPAAHEIEPFLPKQHHVQTILTSRDAVGWEERGITAMKTETLATDTVTSDGVVLLADRANRAPDTDAVKLATELGGLCLALVHAGGYIKDKGNFADYLASYHDYLDQVPAAYKSRDKTVIATTRMSFDRLGDDAKTILNILAHLGAEGLGDWLFMGAARSEYWNADDLNLPQDLRSLCESQAKLTLAFDQLAARSLIEADSDGTWTLHRMTATAVRAMQDGDWDGLATSLLWLNVTGDPNSSAHWGPLALVTPHVQAMLDRDGLPETVEASLLLSTCGIYLDRQHRFEERLVLAEEDWTRAQKAFEPDQTDHPNYATALGNLGVAKQKTSDLSGALVDLERRLALDKDHRPESVKHGIALNHVSDVLLAMGGAENIRLAIEMRKERVRIMEGLLKNDQQNPVLLEHFVMAINNLGYAYHLSGDAHAALNNAKVAVEKSREFLPKGDHGLLLRISNLGTMSLELGAFKDAFPLIEEGFLGLQSLFANNPKHGSLIGKAKFQITSLLIQDRLADDGSGHRAAAARQIADQYGFDWGGMQNAALRYYVTGLRNQGGTALQDAAARDPQVAQMANVLAFQDMVNADPTLKALIEEAEEYRKITPELDARIKARIAELRS